MAHRPIVDAQLHHLVSPGMLMTKATVPTIHIECEMNELIVTLYMILIEKNLYN